MSVGASREGAPSRCENFRRLRSRAVHRALRVVTKGFRPCRSRGGSYSVGRLSNGSTSPPATCPARARIFPSRQLATILAGERLSGVRRLGNQPLETCAGLLSKPSTFVWKTNGAPIAPTASKSCGWLCKLLCVAVTLDVQPATAPDCVDAYLTLGTVSHAAGGGCKGVA